MRLAILAAALTLTACAAVNPSANTQLVLAKSLFVAENTYEAADSLYLQNDAAMKPADKATAKAALLQILTCPAGVSADSPSCRGYLATARTALKSLDSATLAQQVSAITSLAAQVTALAKPGT